METRNAQTVTIENVGQALAMLKEMQAGGLNWGDDYRPLGRTALTRLLEARMAAEVDRHLKRMGQLGEEDRRNGNYRRHLPTVIHRGSYRIETGGATDYLLHLI